MHIFDNKIFDYIPVVSFVKAITDKDEEVLNAALCALRSKGDASVEKVHTYSFLKIDSTIRKIIKCVPVIGNLIVFCADAYAFLYVLFLEAKKKNMFQKIGRTPQFEKIEGDFLRKAVKWGDINAAASLALFSRNGSERQYVYWLKKGIELGSLMAIHELGYFLLDTKHPVEAEKVFDLDRKSFHEQLLLADCYYSIGEIDKALELDSQVEKSGDFGAQYDLALKLLIGENNGRKMDRERAEKLFESALPHLSSLRGLKKCYYDDVIALWGGKKTRKTFTIAANDGYARAMVWLGIIAEQEDKDMRLAMQWYERAGNEGFSDGWRRLGDLYRQDHEGIVEKNIQKVTLYYIKAAIAGNENALKQLKNPNGDLHLKALDNVPAAKEKEILEQELARM